MIELQVIYWILYVMFLWKHYLEDFDVYTGTMGSASPLIA